MRLLNTIRKQPNTRAWLTIDYTYTPNKFESRALFPRWHVSVHMIQKALQSLEINLLYVLLKVNCSKLKKPQNNLCPDRAGISIRVVEWSGMSAPGGGFSTRGTCIDSNGCISQLGHCSWRRIKECTRRRAVPGPRAISMGLASTYSDFAVTIIYNTMKYRYVEKLEHVQWSLFLACNVCFSIYTHTTDEGTYTHQQEDYHWATCELLPETGRRLDSSKPGESTPWQEIRTWCWWTLSVLWLPDLFLARRFKLSPNRRERYNTAHERTNIIITLHK